VLKSDAQLEPVGVRGATLKQFSDYAVSAHLCEPNEPCVGVTVGADVDDNRATVVGKSAKNAYGNRVESFLGIQYATQERFEPSELLLLKGVVDAREMGPVCAQPPSAWLKGSVEEDCLYLNIWRPKLDEDDDEQELLPVLFWIHGGGFIFGSGMDSNFDGANLAGNEKVIVVTINYRLNIFGYLPTTSDHGTGGMNGILDQIRALEWVQKNISPFGGDPDKVTIFGESAGAISACQLSVIPQAKGLFLRAISESGFCGFIPFHEESLGPSLASVGCTSEPCAIADLKEMSTEELLPANAKHGFNPVFDKSVIPNANPANLYSEGSNINPTDMIIGYNTFDDYATFFVPLEDYIKGANLEEAPQLAHVPEDVKTNILTLYSPALYGDSSLAAYAQFRGDSDFGCPSRFLAPTAASSIGGKVFLYQFAMLSGFDYSKASGLLEEANIDEYPTWSSHEAEIPFVFGNTIELGGKKPDIIYPSSFTDQEMVLVKEMMNRWANFARNGDPQAPGLSDSEESKWIPVSNDSEDYVTDPQYMNFGSNGGLMVGSDKEKSDQCNAMLGVYGAHP